MDPITIAKLQAAHVLRQEEWCPDQKPDLSFRGNEMAGEVGEACNVIKKLERERHGWRGKCSSLLRFTRDDAEYVTDSREGDYLKLKCPVCGRGITRFA